MSVITVSHQRRFGVPDHYDDMLDKTCSAMCAMTILGDDLYCIKAERGEDDEPDTVRHPVALYKYPNFINHNDMSTPVTPHLITLDGNALLCKHANSLTGYIKSDSTRVLLMATGNPTNSGNPSSSPQVLEFGENGVVINRISAGKTVYRINYYGNTDKRYFLICQKNNDKSKYTYKKVHIVQDSAGIAHFSKKISCTISAYSSGLSRFSKGNDDFYDTSTSILYTTMFHKEDPITENRIFQYDLSSITEGANYSPMSRILKVDSTGEYKFEVEGMCLYTAPGETSAKKYICTNTALTSSQNDDAIYKIYNAN